MQLYIAITDACDVLGWSQPDFRAVRRCLRPALATQRPSHTGRGRSPDFILLDDALSWFDRVLPNGLSPYNAQRLTNMSRALN